MSCATFVLFVNKEVNFELILNTYKKKKKKIEEEEEEEISKK